MKMQSNIRNIGVTIAIVLVGVLVANEFLHPIRRMWWVDASSGRSRIQLTFMFIPIKESINDTDYSRLLMKYKGVPGPPKWKFCSYKILASLNAPRIQFKTGSTLSTLQEVADALSEYNLSEEQKLEIIDVVQGVVHRGEYLAFIRNSEKGELQILDLSAQETKTLTWRFQPQTTTPGETE